MRLPNRNSERSTQQRPKLIAEFFPGCEHYPRIRPACRVLRCDADFGQHIVAIIEPQIGRHEYAVSALKRLIVEAILGRHDGEHMDKSGHVAHHDVGSVRAKAVERVGDPIKLAPVYRLPVETQQAGNPAHRKRLRRGPDRIRSVRRIQQDA